jgi:hypothetical protein
MEIEKLGTEAFWNLLREDPSGLAREVCSIDLVDLETTLQQHPSLRAWINAAFETSRVQEERAKWTLTKTRAKALLIAKAATDPHTGKNKTVGVLDAEVDNHAAVQEAMEELLDLSQMRASLRAMADSLEDRKDMLIQIAAKHRRESDDYNR